MEAEALPKLFSRTSTMAAMTSGSIGVVAALSKYTVFFIDQSNYLLLQINNIFRNLGLELWVENAVVWVERSVSHQFVGQFSQNISSGTGVFLWAAFYDIKADNIFIPKNFFQKG
jgi:hypothetical protein